MPLDELIASLPSEVLEKPASLDLSAPSDGNSSSSEEHHSTREDSVSIYSRLFDYSSFFIFVSHSSERGYSLIHRVVCPLTCG